ncbi:Pyrroline-5-carboxylate reductase [Ephemeroptericola cinctiostellae]|uniref:Pyrroline-5-carboxylate reductase n=1 Tax=Ephemeroptericola cinctiostellae TaxID=2268024 RepID=A0A345DAH6_9BURK|nr:Rossmann-like and DUF2520 domain-containing protein [Ephemeroptericola cinctiostellae]AXF85364.1 Pyrroline-5-carboxylate reductase [Ephemeroptericola cinctiostellae]
MHTLNIIGAGRVGQTLARLWHAHSVFQIGAVCNRSIGSAQAAVDFIQAGTAFDVDALSLLPAADVWLLACPDDQLQACCTDLSKHGAFNQDSIVFHCSGALTAHEVLQSAKNCGAQIASAHPIKSFANPDSAVQGFTGTFCGTEGDAAALAVLESAFAAIGGHCFTIKPESKTLYHAASVMACNYLVALQEVSIQAFTQAGVAREQAMAILQPIVSDTVNNVFSMGTQAALTGPIARGDAAVVEKQVAALKGWRMDYAQMYQQLGQVTLTLAEPCGISDQTARRLADILGRED